MPQAAAFLDEQEKPQAATFLDETPKAAAFLDEGADAGLTAGEIASAAWEGARKPLAETVRFGVPLAASGVAAASGVGLPVAAGAFAATAPLANRVADIIEGRQPSYQRDVASAVTGAAGVLAPGVGRVVPAALAVRAPVAAGVAELSAQMGVAGAVGTGLTASYQAAAGEPVNWRESLKMGGLTAVLGGIGGALRANEVTRLAQTDREGLVLEAKKLGFQGNSFDEMRNWYAEQEQAARAAAAKPVQPSAPTAETPAPLAAKAPETPATPVQGSEPSPRAPAPTEPAGVAPTEPPPTTTHLAPAAHPVVEFPVKDIQVNKDIVQFKGDANKQGVVEPLAGKFERLGTAPVVLWQKLNGETEIITGRHRLDLAARSSEPTIPAQVVKESDGFTQQMALTFDAESNIRDGQGTVKDYAHYFRNSPDLLPADADARGLRARAKGKAGWALGKDASDDLYTLYANGEIGENKAVAIAQGAPGRADAQASAIRAAKRMTAPELELYARNLARLTGGEKPAGAEQLGFGGIAEDFAAFEEQAAKIAAVQADRLRSNNELILAAQGAAKRPEAARKMGLPVDDPAALQTRIDSLKADNARLGNPDSETWKELAKAAGIELPKPAGDAEGGFALKGDEPAPPPEGAAGPVAEAPLPDPGTIDMFGSETNSLPPTALDKLNSGALGNKPESLELPKAPEAPGQRAKIMQAQMVRKVNQQTLAEGKWPNGSKLTSKDQLRLKDEIARYEAFLNEVNAPLERPANDTETHSMSAGGSGGSKRRAAAPGSPAAPLAPSPQPSALVKDLKRFQAATAPQTLSDTARFTGNLVRELNAKLHANMARADEALAASRVEFDRTPVPADWKYDAAKPLPRNYAFIDAYEGGNAVGLGATERATASELARQNAEWIDRVHNLGTGALTTLIENYFPHLWEDPVKARQVLGALLAKNPLEGPKSFLKKRTYTLFREGLEAGLKPVHDNPIDLWMLKRREVERYVMAQSFIAEMKKTGNLKFVHAFDKTPEGWTTISDAAFTVFGPPTVEIKEAFDAGMRAKTLEVMERLGIPHERAVKIGGQRWGYEQNAPGRPGTERIVTKFGGPDFVIWHELGHALDSRYPDMRRTLFGGDQSEVASARAKRNFKRKLTDAEAETLQLDDELRALVDARAEGQKPSESFKKYLRKTPEKMAVVLQAYLHAPEKMSQLAPTVAARFKSFLGRHPELAMIDEIKPTLALDSATAQMPVGGLVKLGNWTLPDEAARVVNNFLSPGLNPQSWYRSLRETSNLLNGAQLGLSAFHLGFTSLDAAVSRFSLAIEDAMRGNLGTALATGASVPVSPVTNIMRGNALREAVLHGTTDPELKSLVGALEAAGGRIGQDVFWQTQFTRRMTRAFYEARQQLKDGQMGAAMSPAGRAVVNAPFVLIEQSLRPILEYVVPRQKLGVFADMASRELARLGPDATPEVVREAMRKAWDSVDNRMGQVVYDNLFYQRAVKDVALLTFRAYGWQLGKYREAFGGAYDALNAANQLRQGKTKLPDKEPLFTHRMAYLMALPIVVGAIGGVIHYLMTGKRPENGQDYFQPQTGDKDVNGNPVRLNLPSYVKDAISYGKHPLTSLGHSLNPLGSAMFDLLKNADFYNTQIRNPDDPLAQQTSDVAKWASEQFVPFSITGSMKLHEDNAPAWKLVAPFFGVTPVPLRQNMSPAQELAAEIMSGSMPREARTRAQADKATVTRDFIRLMREGRSGDANALRQKGIDAGTLRPEQSAALMERLQFNPLQWQVHHFTPEAAMRVWRVAGDTERRQLRGIIMMKVINANSITPEQRQKLLVELNPSPSQPK